MLSIYCIVYISPNTPNLPDKTPISQLLLPSPGRLQQGTEDKEQNEQNYHRGTKGVNEDFPHQGGCNKEQKTKNKMNKTTIEEPRE